MAWARRCDLGCEAWPDLHLYTRCLICGNDTIRQSDLEPLDEAEARAILLHLQFEIYYERRCRRLGIPVDGDLPDELGDLVGSDVVPRSGRVQELSVPEAEGRHP